jgi:hypothetical protein
MGAFYAPCVGEGNQILQMRWFSAVEEMCGYPMIPKSIDAELIVIPRLMLFSGNVSGTGCLQALLNDCELILRRL